MRAIPLWCRSLLLVLTSVLLFVVDSECQESANLTSLTSPIEVEFQGDLPKSFGTSFFFQVLAPRDPKNAGPQWRTVTSVFLVTNRHVVQPENFARLTRLIFFLRQAANDRIDWVPIPIGRDELAKRLHLHPDPGVDVAAIAVLDLLQAKIQSYVPNVQGKTALLPWNAVHHEQLPGVSKITISEGDDVVVVGYPRAFYDNYNRLPVLKRGMLASPWGAKYRGQNAFLIDYRFFHGSSGSPVISQPTHVAFEKGRPLYSEERQFLFLGIYSGEPFTLGPVTETDAEIRQEKVRVDMGLVWYPSTIEETIQTPPLRP